MSVFALLFIAAFFQARATCNVEFATDDRIDPLGFALCVKIESPKHIAVIGEGKMIHPEFRRPAYETGYTRGTI